MIATEAVIILDGNLKEYISRLRHGKRTEEQRNKKLETEREHPERKQRLLESWPQLVSDKLNLKNKIVKMFRQQTSTETLSTFTCSSFGEETLVFSSAKIVSY